MKIRRTTVVFVSSCSGDEHLRDQLLIYLQPLFASGQIKVWEQSRIGAGEDRKSAIEAAIQRADIAVLVVTARYLASEYCMIEEVHPLCQHV